MEIRVYKTGEDKKIDIRGTSFDHVKTVDKFKDIVFKYTSGETISIFVEGERIVSSEYENYKDFSGNNLGSNISETINGLRTILLSNSEVDSFVIGDDLSQKSSETIFTHNKAGTSGLGGRLVVDNDEAKLDITRSTGQGETSVTVSAEDISGSDRGTITGKVAWSTGTQDAFTVQGGNPGLGSPHFTVNGRFIAENGIYVGSGGGTELAITDLDKVPASLGSTGQVLAVNSGGTALEFVNQTGGSGGSGSASEALFVIDSTGGTDNVTSTASNLTLDSTQFISNASNFTVSNNEVTVNMDMRACISFHVGFKDPNGADRSEGQAFLERSTDSGTTWSLVTGSNSFAYLRNGGNNDQDTATSGNVIMAVSNGDKFRVRVKTTGTGLTASTIANMSGFSIFDLLGGATGATGATGPAGADGADGTNGTNGADGADGADGDGFTGGSYNSSTGIVTFTSDDGLGFSTGDLRSSLAFADLTGKPTTISGYGITDALQLGTTSTTALAGDTSIPSATSDLTNDSSFVQTLSSVAAQPVRQYYAQQSNFPSATTWHGAIAHSHSDGAMYFAHGGSWVEMANASDLFSGAYGDLTGTPTIPVVGTDAQAYDSNLTSFVSAFTLPTTDGSSGQVLQTNGSGTLSFATVSGGSGSTTLLGLTDTPSSFGSAGQVLAVNSSGNAVEFVNQSGGSGTQQTLDGQKIEFVTRSTSYNNGAYEGKVMKFGTATLQSLKLYQYTSSGWSPTDANQTGKAEGLLGLALGTSESSDGLLLDGLISATAFNGFSAGDKLYVSETESAITNTAPTATGSIVRIVGYALGSGYVHFNPSDNFIELA